jgi:predicted DNA-binding transcriptional regulator AlpA
MLVVEPWTIRGGSRGSHYKAIRDGLMTPGVPGPSRRVGWPAAELAAIDAAIGRGAGPEAIRELVRKLMERRASAADDAAADAVGRVVYRKTGDCAPGSPTRELLTPSEVEKVLGVGTTKRRELEKLPGFPSAVQFGPRTRRHVRSEVVEWMLAQRRRVATGEAA